MRRRAGGPGADAEGAWPTPRSVNQAGRCCADQDVSPLSQKDHCDNGQVRLWISILGR